MPQISIVRLSEVEKDGRFDAEFYKPIYLKIYRDLGRLKLSPLGKLAFITDGQHGYFEVDEKSNIRQIVGRDMVDEYNYLDRTNASKLASSTHNKNLRSNLEENDLVLSTVGTVGKVGIVLKETLPANINQSVCRIKINNKKTIDSYFLSAFLKSKYGQLQIDKFSAGQIQVGFYLHKVRELLIPLINERIQEKIGNVVRESMKKFLQSKSLYKEAEEILLKELNLENYKPNHELAFSSDLKEVINAERFDADYFAPKYKEIEKRIEKYENGFFTLSKEEIKDKNFFPKADKKYNYIELSNVSNNGEINGFTSELGENLPTRARRKLIEGDVIISSIEGSLNSCALITKDYENCLCSNGFFVLNSKKLNSETFLVLFKSLIIQKLLERGCKGTILTSISGDELRKIKIPLISKPIQNKISEKIQESFKLKKESKELLEKAKKMVEEEIEKEAKL